jgi:hypothetical protein
MLFSPHEPRNVPECFVALIPKVCTRAAYWKLQVPAHRPKDYVGREMTASELIFDLVHRSAPPPDGADLNQVLAAGQSLQQNPKLDAIMSIGDNEVAADPQRLVEANEVERPYRLKRQRH